MWLLTSVPAAIGLMVAGIFLLGFWPVCWCVAVQGAVRSRGIAGAVKRDGATTHRSARTKQPPMTLPAGTCVRSAGGCPPTPFWTTVSFLLLLGACLARPAVSSSGHPTCRPDHRCPTPPPATGLTYLTVGVVTSLTLGQIGAAAPGSANFFDQLSQPNGQLVAFAVAGGVCLAVADIAVQVSCPQTHRVSWVPLGARPPAPCPAGAHVGPGCHCCFWLPQTSRRALPCSGALRLWG